MLENLGFVSSQQLRVSAKPMLFYGPAETGKTHLLKTAAEAGYKVAVISPGISPDYGVSVLAATPGIEVTEIRDLFTTNPNTPDQVLGLFDTVRLLDEAIKSGQLTSQAINIIALDHLGGAYELVLQEFKKQATGKAHSGDVKGFKDAMNDFTDSGAANKLILNEVIKKMNSWAGFGIYPILIAHDKPASDRDLAKVGYRASYARVRLDVTPQVRNDLEKMFPFVIYFDKQVETSGFDAEGQPIPVTRYMIKIGDDNNIFTKFKVPNKANVPGIIYEPTWSKIIDLMQGKNVEGGEFNNQQTFVDHGTGFYQGVDQGQYINNMLTEDVQQAYAVPGQAVPQPSIIEPKITPDAAPEQYQAQIEMHKQMQAPVGYTAPAPEGMPFPQANMDPVPNFGPVNEAATQQVIEATNQLHQMQQANDLPDNINPNIPAAPAAPAAPANDMNTAFNNFFGN